MNREKKSGCVLLAALGAILFFAALPGYGQVVISEFMAVNNATLVDEDGDYTDWIELHNEGTEAVDLEGWYLTDNDGNLTKWRFPATVLGAGEHLVVFASNKDRAVSGEELHTDFKLGGDGEYLALVEPDGLSVAMAFAPEYPPQAADISYGLTPPVDETLLVTNGAVCRYHVPQDDSLGETWTGGAFDDAGWDAGATGLGFDGGATWTPYIATDVATAIVDQSTLYMRMPFTVASVSSILFLDFRARYNDGFVAYINGQEVARSNAPEPPTWDAVATALRTDTSVKPFLIENPSGVLAVGTNTLAIHAMNVSVRDDEFLMAPELLANVVGGSLADGVGVYFLTPTPGEANDEGTAELGPRFVDVTDAAVGVSSGDTLVVTAHVARTLYSVSSVRVLYRAMFETESSLALRDDGVSPDATADDDFYTGSVMLSKVSTGQMFRWRFEATDDHAQTTRLPRFADPLDSPEYFGTMARDDSIESLLPVIHWFVEVPGDANNRTGTRGCLWHLDRFYDNVHFSLHGQSTSGGAFQKKSYNVDFNRGDRFRYREDEKKVKDIDFLTNYADKSKCRNTMAYQFYRDADHPAHFSYPIRLQQNGAFFSTTDMVEDGDERYLDRAGLDEDGVLYKMYNRCDSATTGVEKKTRKDEDNSDLAALVAGLNLTGASRESFVYDHVDIPRAVNYLATQVIVNNRDHGHKNYYLYRDTEGNGEWTILHWDADLCLGHNWVIGIGYFDDLMRFVDPIVYSWQNNRLYNAIYGHADTRAMVMRRIRTLMDTFLKPAGTPAEELYFEPQVDALLQLIDPEGEESDADLDLAKWGTWGNMEDMRGGTARMVDEYLPGRRDFLYGPQSVGQGGEIPEAVPADVAIVFGDVEYLPASGRQDQEFVELVNTNDYAVDISGWSLEGGVSLTFRGGTVLAAGQRLYVSPDVTAFRARSISPSGSETRFVQGEYKGQLGDKGDSLALIDNTGREVDTYSYEGFAADYTGGLRVTEIMVNPANAENEFVELFNAGEDTADLTDIVLTGGIAFDFRSGGMTSLGTGEYCVVVRNVTTFTNQYGSGSAAFIAGVYTGHLDNAGDTLKVADIRNREILFDCDFEDRRGWPQSANGAGHSLVPLVLTDQASGILNYGWNWRASRHLGGSPGTGDPDPGASVVINEIGAHTDTGLEPPYDSDDWIELYNPTDEAIDIGGWYLSDRSDNLKRYQIPAGTTVGGHDHLLLTENLHFHTNRTSESGFGLNKAGDELYLSRLPGTSEDRVVDALRFKGQVNGQSIGRHSDGAAYWYALSPTTDAANAAPTERVTLSEIMFQPEGTGSVDNTQDEFIELHNPTSQDAALSDADGGWRIDGGVSYTFASNAVLPAGGTLLLVPFDPETNLLALAAFKARYGLTLFDPVMLGPYDGKLSNTGERLALERPQAPDMPGDGVSWIIVDEAIYFAMWPWPDSASGTGRAFARLPGTGAGNDPLNWTVPEMPSPGIGFADITLVTPEHGREFLLPFNTVMRAEIDLSQVSGSVHRVEFYEGSTQVGTDGAAPYEGVFASGASQTSFTFTARLVDDFGVRTSAVSAVTAVGPLTVENVGDSNTTEYATTLWGSFEGCDYADVVLYWGPVDGGTNATAWTHANVLGRLTAALGDGPTLMSRVLTGLVAGRPYYYRWCATRSGGVRWAPASARFDTEPFSRWPHRMSIAFDGYTGGAPLTNFPALVRFSTAISGFSYDGFAFPNATDLRFADSDGSTLFYEIEKWDTNGTSTVWVRIPRLTVATAIRAYWGNTAADALPAYTADGSVWSERFEAVWHFSDTLTDSTAAKLDAVNHGSAQGAGAAGGGRQFDGTAAYVEPGVGADWYNANGGAMTISLWARGNAQERAVFGARTNENWLSVGVRPAGRIEKWACRVSGAAEISVERDPGDWDHLAMAFGAGSVTVYYNGDAVKTSPSSNDLGMAETPLLGAINSGGPASFFNGEVDELRLSTAQRSSAWLEAEYMTVAPAGTFATYTMLPSDIDGDGMGDAWEERHLGGIGATPGGHGDSDPMSNGDEYVAGTDPTNGASFFAVDLQLSNGMPIVRFHALSPDGAGYEGLTRIYGLQYRSNLFSGAWIPVPGCTEITGQGQTVTHTNASNAMRFYRGNVRLE